MHILSPETDNCPSWISGRERMTVESISWSFSTKECCRPRRGLNPRPPGLQSDGASNWATQRFRRYSPLPVLSCRRVRVGHLLYFNCAEDIASPQVKKSSMTPTIMQLFKIFFVHSVFPVLIFSCLLSWLRMCKFKWHIFKLLSLLVSSFPSYILTLHGKIIYCTTTGGHIPGRTRKANN